MTAGTIDFGRATYRWRIGKFSGRLDRRELVVGAVLAVVVAILGVVSLGLGDYPVSPLDVVRVLTGGGDPSARLAIGEWQAPRILAALVLGAALALSGAIFQLLTRNPLGSPDIIGFSTGSYTGALIATLVIGGGYVATSAGALIGGIATAIAVYALAFRGGIVGFRLVITGVAVSAMAAAANFWLILRADLDDAMSAAQWGAGTLETVTWATATPAIIVIGLLIPMTGLMARREPILELSADLARGLGAQTILSQWALPVLGVALTATATALTGPIAFVSLAAPQLSRRLCRLGRTPLVVTALMGAFLLLVSDVIATRAFAPQVLPVGVVTVVIGGGYLCWLLYREMRVRR